MFNKTAVTTTLGILLVGLFSGCSSEPSGGGQTPIKVAKFDGQEVGVISGNPAFSSKGVSGEGSFIFRQSLPEDDNHYELHFELEPSGSVTLVPNAKAGLTGPVAVTFSRKADDTLRVTLKDGPKSTDIDEDFETPLSADGKVVINVDVHGHGHLTLFKGVDPLEKADFNKISGGTFWGLRLSNAQITSGRRFDPRDPD